MKGTGVKSFSQKHEENGKSESRRRKNHSRLTTMLHKGYVYVTICLLGILLVGCSSDEKVTKISIESNEQVVDIKQTIEVKIDTEPSEYDTTKLKIVSSDDKIIKEKEITKDTVTLTSLEKEGSATIYVEQKDGVKSNEITIKVEDKEKIEKQKKEEEAKKAKEAEEAKRLVEEQAAKEAEEKRLAAEEQARKQAAEEQAAQEAARASQQTQNVQSQTEQINVYIPRTGSKYHSNPNCSNMKNPSLTTLEDAQRRGYEPCKKCY